MLEVRDLVKVFNKDTDHEKMVFNDFTLKVRKNDFITIIGSNGAGKSTLLNIIGGSIRLDCGEIILNGEDITSEKEFYKSKKISRVFQNPELGTSPNMTILENLSMVLNKHKKNLLRKGVNKKNIPHFKELLSELQLGLENHLNRKVSLLSGGQKQALALIMSIINTPQLLLLDEHTAALDPNTSKKVLDITQNLVNQFEIPTLMVTHNMADALKYGNRLIMLDEGEIILDIKDSEKQQLTSENLIEYFRKVKEHKLSDRMVFV